MPDLQHLLLFITAGVLLNLTPGPDVLYITSHALRAGVRAGLVAVLGISAGCFVHVIAAAVGVSALLASSAAAFTVLKWVGAAYLVWVGVRLLFWRGRPQTAAPGPGHARNPPCAGTSAGASPGAPEGPDGPAIFRGGFLTNALNPKVALFFLAFLPQFIAPHAERKAPAFVLLGLLFIANATVVNAGWALAAAWLARRAALQRGLRRLDRAAGALFIAFGLKLAFTDSPSR